MELKKCNHQGGFSDIVKVTDTLVTYKCELCGELITGKHPEHFEFSKKPIKIIGLEKMQKEISNSLKMKGDKNGKSN